MKMITKRGIFLWILCIFFIVGIGFLTYSLATEGSTWVMKTYNSHVYSHNELIAAGEITDRDGTVLVETKDGSRVYSDDKSTRKSTLHTIGDTKGFISTGIQTQFKSQLVGYNTLFGVYEIERYGHGNNMKLTVDSDIDNVALKALGNYKGTVAVCNYKTGDIVCMVSTPTYDVEDVPSNINSSDDYEGVYINRFLTGLYTPGSTFKVITSIAALQANGNSMFDKTWKCTGGYSVDGDRVVCNATHGTVNFKNALAKSCNSAFAQIAIDVGAKNLIATVDQLGLTSAVTISNEISTTKGIFKLSEKDNDADIGWTGIGQGKTLVCPAAMLRVMCAIANNGKAVPLNIVDTLTNQTGKKLGIDFAKDETVLMSSDIASTMKEMMRYNVTNHYGDSKYKGLSLCAKSGTAQIDNIDAHNTAWFVGFTDDEENPYAFVVVVEKGNSGSQTAGPIANKVLQAIYADDK